MQLFIFCFSLGEREEFSDTFVSKQGKRQADFPLLFASALPCGHSSTASCSETKFHCFVCLFVFVKTKQNLQAILFRRDEINNTHKLKLFTYNWSWKHLSGPLRNRREPHVVKIWIRDRSAASQTYPVLTSRGARCTRSRQKRASADSPAARLETGRQGCGRLGTRGTRAAQPGGHREVLCFSPWAHKIRRLHNTETWWIYQLKTGLKFEELVA